jgi:hypothetical protein
VGIAAHNAFLLAFVIAAMTLLATLLLPARLSPVRTLLKREQPAE